MKWEGKMAILVFGLLVVLIIRGFWGVPEDKIEIVPLLMEVDQPFYPVYFGTTDGEKLVPEFRSGDASIEQVLADLVGGPFLPDLTQTMPADVRVLGYRQQGAILFVSFSHHLITNHPGGSTGEILTVYSIVNTLVGVAGIERVQILVENEPIETLAGHLDLGEPLQKDYTILGGSLI